jgi:protein ImuA
VLDRRLLEASLFVDPPDDAACVWAIDLALRAGGGEGHGGNGGGGGDGGVALVIADGSRLDMSASRRLQLAAEAGARAAEARGTPHVGGIGLILRPPWERKQLSAAATRWMVHPSTPAADVPVNQPRWNVELLRCKGMQPPPDGRREWTLELDRAGRVVCVFPPLVDRPAAPARAAI